jgi:hypothetical protein
MYETDIVVKFKFRFSVIQTFITNEAQIVITLSHTKKDTNLYPEHWNEFFDVIWRLSYIPPYVLLRAVYGQKLAKSQDTRKGPHKSFGMTIIFCVHPAIIDSQSARKGLVRRKSVTLAISLRLSQV